LKKTPGKGVILSIIVTVLLALLLAFAAEGARGPGGPQGPPLTAMSRSDKRRPAHRHTVHKASSALINPDAVNDPSLERPAGPTSSASAILRAQILLARAHFSCGEIDAHYGANLRGAIADFQATHSLPASGTVDTATWKVLNTDTAPALLRTPVAPEDVAGPYFPIPQDMMEKAKLPALPYSSPLEAPRSITRALRCSGGSIRGRGSRPRARRSSPRT
jgi:hypothetical protein